MHALFMRMQAVRIHMHDMTFQKTETDHDVNALYV